MPPLQIPEEVEPILSTDTFDKALEFLELGYIPFDHGRDRDHDRR